MKIKIEYQNHAIGGSVEDFFSGETAGSVGLPSITVLLNREPVLTEIDGTVN